MPSWITSILLAAATTLFIGLVVNPRLEARKPRIEAKNNQKRVAWEARAEFSKRVLTILSACGRLQESAVPPSLAETRPALAERLDAERQRWLAQLDEATRYLVDNMELFALGYATDRLRRIVGQFVVHARAVVLSDRPVEKQIERLTALTGPIQNLFFVPRWRVTTVVRSFEQFERALAALDEDLPDDLTAAPVPAPTTPQTTT
ncbi:hypothetical protein [Streptomyces sp. M54]|uniref:hypothetical protein n=1 Tax=Streptomyces sp. M54 TaxID=2759525 RepID=UPI001A8EA906|nr:hypothetical protein [Streptomyces sp. M54]QSS91298.1 hypothetical protein H3V39_13250 [Streptomyces sp. M54]